MYNYIIKKKFKIYFQKNLFNHTNDNLFLWRNFLYKTMLFNQKTKIKRRNKVIANWNCRSVKWEVS